MTETIYDYESQVNAQARSNRPVAQQKACNVQSTIHNCRSVNGPVIRKVRLTRLRLL
jgi:hypothetical protein